MEGSKNPIFGKLDPMTILGLLMKNNPNSLKSKFSKLKHCTAAVYTYQALLFLESDVIQERVDQGANFSQPPAYSSTQFPPLYTPYNPQQSEDVGSTQDSEKPRNKFDNHKYIRDDFINLFDYNNQPTNSQEPIPNYDQDYYSLNEVALGSELHKHTYDEKEHQNIDRIDHGDYEYYDYDFENEDSNNDDNDENDSSYYDYENDSSDYNYESDKANEASKESYDETEDGDYEVYYTYYYDYIDPEELQSKFEKLPDPSYQIASNLTTFSNQASSNTTLPFLESSA